MERLEISQCSLSERFCLLKSHFNGPWKNYIGKTQNLKELPSRIGGLCNLDVLEIGNDWLEVLPPWVGYLKTLKHFCVYHSPKLDWLDCLLDSFGLLTQLTVLRLQKCGVEVTEMWDRILITGPSEDEKSWKFKRDCQLRVLPFRTVWEAETLLLKGGRAWNQLDLPMTTACLGSSCYCSTAQEYWR